jgi:hypothetical protein
MSIKSSVINLYNGSDGAHQFQSKVTSTQIDIKCSTLPIVVTGTNISFSKVGGPVINDVVETITTTLAQITQLQATLGTLFDDIELSNTVYKIKSVDAYGQIGITHADGTELSDAEKLELVNRHFTFDNTVRRFTGVKNNGIMYVSSRFELDSVGLVIYLITPEIYKITGFYDDAIGVSNVDDTNVDKETLVGRYFVVDADYTRIIRFTGISGDYMNTDIPVSGNEITIMLDLDYLS